MTDRAPPTISVVPDPPVAVIELRSEAGVHMLTEAFPAELEEAVATLEEAPEVRAIVLTGRTKVFCAGADLSLADQLAEPEFARWWLDAHNAAIARLAEVGRPTIAAVNGAAFGAGFNLALACDFIIAASNASFCQAFIRIGLATDVGSLYLLPRRVGIQRARELAYTGRALSADEALELGVADEIVEPERLEDRSLAFAGELAARAPLALAAIKRGMAKGPLLGLRDSLELEKQLQLDVLASSDFQEGAAAFLEKREPRYRGS